MFAASWSSSEVDVNRIFSGKATRAVANIEVPSPFDSRLNGLRQPLHREIRHRRSSDVCGDLVEVTLVSQQFLLGWNVDAHEAWVFHGRRGDP